jgi:hypothetical protein
MRARAAPPDLNRRSALPLAVRPRRPARVPCRRSSPADGARGASVHVFIHTRGPIGGSPQADGGGLSRARNRLLLVLSEADWDKLDRKDIWPAVLAAAPLLRQSAHRQRQGAGGPWLPFQIR